MALPPDHILAKWATPQNIAGLLVAYLSWKVSISASWFLVTPFRVTLASLNNAILLLSLAHLCFLFVTSQKCAWTSFR
jgi:hypothetical protein